MGRHTLHGNPPITVHLRRSTRARRLSLRVSRLDGRVSLTLPHFTPEDEGISFLQSKEGWLRKQLVGVRPIQQVQLGGTVPFRGEQLEIREGKGRGVATTQSAILIAPGRPVGAQLRAFFRTEARSALAAASDRYAAMLGRRYTRLTMRDTRSRWGSCTSDGGLMYSWRLILAPPEVLDYVAAHEVAHLAEMNHGPAFWNTVEQLCPDFAQHRRWLKLHGDTLHSVSFDD
ncbi:M48 family metallopeptidase [Yoonia litorea]|uniref:YgjP-like metallopeptidase domain-containing protein n=1 Tax=Yoonia litorea TaxID=1123755 RepID=A0A1I6L5R7_9RHOB|nr:SprT family zinc-dependent metalloprotease [Yoonia litorea]SFR98809.1 hypothetical protein SAMN05444714_0219 [Yoonia litorea]